MEVRDMLTGAQRRRIGALRKKMPVEAIAARVNAPVHIVKEFMELMRYSKKKSFQQERKPQEQVQEFFGRIAGWADMHLLIKPLAHKMEPHEISKATGIVVPSVVDCLEVLSSFYNVQVFGRRPPAKYNNQSIWS